MPFSAFYFLFKCIFKGFSLLKSRKREILLAGDDVASVPRWRADVARRTTAQVRRGDEATWQGRGWPTRGAGGAQRRGHVAGGHACPRVHADARVGRHVAGRVGR